MTEDTKNEFLNLVLYIVLNLMLLGVQASFWPSLFGSFSAPHFLMYSLLFFALFHNLKWGLIFLALAVVLYSSFSIVPIEIIFFSLSIIYVMVSQIKKRVFWSGASYFALITGVSVTVFHLNYYLLCWLLEMDATGFAQPKFGFWFMQIASSLLFSPVFYWIYVRLEAATRGFDMSDIEEAL